jgi:hypothetical protein
MESFFEEKNHGMHPLMNGKIIQHLKKNLLKIVVEGGFLYISKIKNHKTSMLINSNLITHPGQLHTSTIDLEAAKSKTIKISSVL